MFTFSSNTPESHADRPPEVQYSERLITDKRQGEGGTERPCSSHIQLEMAVSQLQRDMEDSRAERELARNPPTSEAVGVHIDAGQSGKSTARCSRPLCVRMAGTMSR